MVRLTVAACQSLHSRAPCSHENRSSRTTCLASRGGTGCQLVVGIQCDREQKGTGCGRECGTHQFSCPTSVQPRPFRLTNSSRLSQHYDEATGDDGRFERPPWPRRLWYASGLTATPYAFTQKWRNIRAGMDFPQYDTLVSYIRLIRLIIKRPESSTSHHGTNEIH